MSCSKCPAHPAAIDDGFQALRNGGTAALLGIPSKPITFDLTNHVIFKGATVLGINGRKMFETWYQMEELLLSGRLELDEIITHQIPLEKFAEGFAPDAERRGDQGRDERGRSKSPETQPVSPTPAIARLGWMCFAAIRRPNPRSDRSALIPPSHWVQ